MDELKALLVKLQLKLQEAKCFIVASYEELSRVGIDCKRLSSEKCHFYDLTEIMHGITGMFSAWLTTFSVYFLETVQVAGCSVNGLQSTECSTIILLLW